MQQAASFWFLAVSFWHYTLNTKLQTIMNTNDARITPPWEGQGGRPFPHQKRARPALLPRCPALLGPAPAAQVHHLRPRFAPCTGVCGIPTCLAPTDAPSGDDHLRVPGGAVGLILGLTSPLFACGGFKGGIISRCEINEDTIPLNSKFWSEGVKE